MTLVDLNNQPVADFAQQQASDPVALHKSLEPAPLPSPDVSSTFGAAFRTENIVGSFLTNYNSSVDFDKADPDWKDRWGELKGTHYEEHSDAFMGVFNNDAWEARKVQLDKEIADRKTLEHAGWLGIGASMTAGLVDLPSLIPGSVILRGANGGIKVARTAASTAALGAAASIGTEAILHQNQHLRTKGETAMAVGATTLLSALLGAGVAKSMSNAQHQSMAGKLMDEVDDAPDNVDVGDIQAAVRQVYEAKSLSADALRPSKEKATFANSVQKAMGKLQKWSPGMRGISYENRAGSELTAEMVESPALKMTNVEEGALSQPQAVETLMNLEIDGRGNVRRRDIEQIYKAARAEGLGMPDAQFRERVALAMRRGDEDPGGNKFISEAAARNREVLEHYAELGQKMELLPEDLTPKTALSYLSRVWDIDKVVKHRPKLHSIIRDNVHKATRALEGKGKGSLSEPDLEDYLDQVADEIIDTLTEGGYDLTRLDYLRVTSNGPLKGRTLDIDDELVEEFLVNDSEFLMDRYVRVMAGQTEFKRRFGTTDMEEILEKPKIEMEEMRIKAESIKDPKQQAKRLKQIDKEWKAFRRDMYGLRDRLFGTLYLNERTNKMGTLVDAANTLAYVSFGGFFSLASLPEMGAMIIHDMVRPFTKQGMGKLAKDIGAMKLLKSELQDMGVGVDLIRDHRLSILTGTADVLDKGDPIRNFAREARRLFSRINGLTYITAMMKSVAGTSVHQRVMRNAVEASAKGFDTLAPHERQWMAALGLGKGDAERLGKQFKQHGTMSDNGAYVPNRNQWDMADEAIDDIARRFSAAVKKGVDQTIITPGAGDMPLYADSNLGRLLSLFTSFTFASLSRISMNATVSSNYGVAAGLVTMSSLGTMSYMLREKAKGREITNNPGTLIAEGIDRSGLLGMISYGNNVFERVSGLPGLTTGASSLFPNHDQSPPASRFVGRRGVFSSLAGPAVGWGEDVFSTWHALLDDSPMSAGEKKRALKLVPGNNLFYLQQLLQSGIKE